MFHRRIVRALAIALVVGALAVPAALAATFVGEESYTLEAGKTVEGDLYAFASIVQINGTVAGDLITAASTVRIGPTGVVEGDLIAAAQQVIVEGRVEDDVRAAGYVVRLATDAAVGDDVLMAGFSVEAAAGSQVGGDLIGAGYQGVVDGSVGRDVEFSGNALRLNGPVAGDVNARIGAEEGAPPTFLLPGIPQVELIGGGLQIGDRANIGGELKVTSPTEIQVPPEVASKVTVELEEKIEEAAEKAERERGPGQWVVGVIKDYVALLLVGLLLVWLVPRALGLAGEILDAKVLPSAGWGCLSFFLAFVGLVALFVLTLLALIIIGVVHIGPLVGPVLSAAVVLGTLFTFGLYLLAWVAKVVAGQWLGRLLVRNLTPGTAMARLGPLVLGLAILAILINIPTIGWLFAWIANFVGLGALVLASRPYWPRRGEPLPAAMPSA